MASYPIMWQKSHLNLDLNIILFFPADDYNVLREAKKRDTKEKWT